MTELKIKLDNDLVDSLISTKLLEDIELNYKYIKDWESRDSLKDHEVEDLIYIKATNIALIDTFKYYTSHDEWHKLDKLDERIP